MAWKRSVALSSLLLTLAALGPVAFAEEPPTTEPATPGTEKPAPPPPPAAEAPKPHFWGDRFALYIEANTGGAKTARDINATIITTSNMSSTNKLNLFDIDHGRLAIGWTLPAQRGMFKLVWTGYRETSYEFNAVGSENYALSRGNLETPGQIDAAVPWWKVRARNGSLQAHQGIPIIEDDQTTITYEPDNPGTNTSLSGRVADDLQHSVQMVDALFQREFGGRMWRGRWSTGFRYFDIEGTNPAAAWLINGSYAGIGYTDGTYLHLVAISNTAKGIGPTGSMEAQLRLFKTRLVLYAEGRVAFVYEKVEADTGNIFTLAVDASAPRDPVTGIPARMYLVPTRLQEDRKKTAWHVSGEVGARVRILEGLQFELGAGQTSYQDCMLLPTHVLIPSKYSDASNGVSALYNTRDFLVSVWHAGFSFQF
jgi:hypothetical protein